MTNLFDLSQPPDADIFSRKTALKSLVIVARHHGIHLTQDQLIRKFLIDGAQITTAEIVRVGLGVGLSVKALTTDHAGLQNVKKALPALVLLKNKTWMVLQEVGGTATDPNFVLRDPAASEDNLLSLDSGRFHEAWGGEIIVAKRCYEIREESQPFSIGLISALIFRDRRIGLDIVIAALAMSFLSLTPILFWQILAAKVLPYRAFSTFTLLCILMIFLTMFETAFASLRRYLLLRLTTRVDIGLSSYVFEKVLNLPVDYFETTPLGLTLHNMHQMTRIRSFLTGQLFGTVLDAGVLLFFLPVMFYFSATLTCVVLIICLLMAIWIVVMLPGYRHRSSAAEAAEAARGAFLSQTIHGIRTVKSLALETKQRHEWDVLISDSARKRLKEGDFANLIESVVRPMERLLVSGTLALGVYFAMTTTDALFIGSLFAFLMLSQRVAAPLIQVASLVQQYDEARGAVKVVAKLVNQPAEEGRDGNGVKSPLKGSVEFSNVRFKYKGAINPALRGVSFSVPQGTTIGVMGRSGSGKTTITRLLQRLHSEYSGLIKLDGIDVREYDVDHLRSNLGVVLQENFLFSGSIRSNICAAKSGATFEEVVYAARLAGAEEFIDKLPRGYETHVYEGSPNLSGGQRQRLAIARALITDPKILILDEATSALDAESEAIVNANLRRIAEGRTMIVISHRLSSLVYSDAILVLDQGRVHDIGRHMELLDRCDIYSALWNQQNSHIQEDPLHGSKLRGLNVA